MHASYDDVHALSSHQLLEHSTMLSSLCNSLRNLNLSVIIRKITEKLNHDKG